MRSMQMRRAGRLPCLAFVITFLTSSSASPSRSCSARTVATFRAPGGRPFGFPLRPFRKGRPRCFGAVDSVDTPLHICVASINQVARSPRSFITAWTVVEVGPGRWCVSARRRFRGYRPAAGSGARAVRRLGRLAAAGRRNLSARQCPRAAAREEYAAYCAVGLSDKLANAGG